MSAPFTRALKVRHSKDPRMAIIENATLPFEAEWDAEYVCFSGFFGPHKPETFAAAPEMLKALKAAQVWLDFDGRFDMQGINASIAKAEGRS